MHNLNIKRKMFSLKVQLLGLNADHENGEVEPHVHAFLSKFYGIKIIKLRKQLIK